MQDERWVKIEQIFNQAVLLPPQERKSFVEDNCSEDEKMRAELVSLIEADLNAAVIFSEPAFPLVARLLDSDYFRFLKKKDFAQYKVKKMLGRGSTSAVFLAEDTNLERPVALKFLPLPVKNNHELVRRFKHEAKTASAISHENVAHIYEFGSHDENHFLAMEYVAGKTLRRLLNEHAIDLQQAVEIAFQIAKGLRAAHKAGVIHRDIKPENIIVNDEGVVKILDFGIARITGKQRSQSDLPHDSFSGTITGTTAYMSPEQIQGKTLNEQTDLWSLGVVIYEMVAGVRPFWGETASDLQDAISQKDPPPVSVNIPQIQIIIDKSLAKARQERFASADEMIKDLEIARRQVYDYLEKQQIEHSRDFSPEKKTSAADFFYNPVKTFSSVGVFLILFVLFLSIAFFLLRKPESEIPGSLSVQMSSRVPVIGKVIRAVFSKDGEWLAYASEEAGKQGLFLRPNKSFAGINADQQKTLLTPSEIRFTGITFAPDGKHIYYSAVSTGMPARLYRISTEGGTPEKILDKIEGAAGVSPDGGKLAFLRLSDDESHESLIIADTDGKNERVLHTRRMPEFIPHLAQPVWSPDGKTILASIGTYGKNKVVEIVPAAIRVSDGEVTPVFTKPWAEIWQADWLPDGTGFIFTGRAELSHDNKQLWVVSFPGGEISRLTNDSNDYFGVNVSNNKAGNEIRVATLILERRSALWVVDLSDPNTRARKITDGADDSLGVSWAKTGSIFFGSMANGRPDVWAIDAGGKNRRHLTVSKFAEMYPTISGNGRFVFFISEQSGIKSLWRMNLDGTEAKPIALGVSAQNFAMTPGGEMIYYYSYFEGGGALWRVSADGGTPEKIADGNFQYPSISRDGKYLVTSLTDRETNEIKLVIREVENPTNIVKILKPLPEISLSPTTQGVLRWSPDSKAIAYIVTRKGIGNIILHPLDEEQPKNLTDFRSLYIYSFDWSPDDNYIVCSRGEQTRTLNLLTLK